MTLQDLMSLLDQKIPTHVAVLDFSKAFDTVPHDKLLVKLQALWYKWEDLGMDISIPEAAAAKGGSRGSSIR